MIRGLTIIETLMSLSVLSLLVVAIGAWTSFAGAATARLDPARWHAAVDRVLDLVELDLITGDFVPPGDDDRVVVESDSLTIITREPGVGAVEVEYRIDALRGRGRGRGCLLRGDRVLLTEADGIDVEFDPVERRLRVEITSADGRTQRREFRIP